MTPGCRVLVATGIFGLEAGTVIRERALGPQSQDILVELDNGYTAYVLPHCIQPLPQCTETRQ